MTELRFPVFSEAKNDLKTSYIDTIKFESTWTDSPRKIKSPQWRENGDSFFPNDLHLAVLCKDAYQKAMTNPPLDEWTCIAMGYSESILNGYLGKVYYNEQTRQLVIAHKGTELTSLGDQSTDLNGIIDDNISAPQIGAAIRFVAEVLAFWEKEDLTVTITGHSLGGWLAQLTGFSANFLDVSDKCVSTKRKPLRKHYHVVAFDSPGCREMLFKFFNYFFRDETYLPYTMDINVCLTFPNAVNRIKTHFGFRYWIKIQGDRNRLWSYVLDSSLSTHSLKNIIKRLEGLFENPPSSRKQEVTEWPPEEKTHTFGLSRLGRISRTTSNLGMYFRGWIRLVGRLSLRIFPFSMLRCSRLISNPLSELKVPENIFDRDQKQFLKLFRDKARHNATIQKIKEEVESCKVPYSRIQEAAAAAVVVPPASDFDTRFIECVRAVSPGELVTRVKLFFQIVPQVRTILQHASLPIVLTDSQFHGLHNVSFDFSKLQEMDDCRILYLRSSTLEKYRVFRFLKEKNRSVLGVDLHKLVHHPLFREELADFIMSESLPQELRDSMTFILDCTEEPVISEETKNFLKNLKLPEHPTQSIIFISRDNASEFMASLVQDLLPQSTIMNAHRIQEISIRDDTLESALRKEVVFQGVQMNVGALFTLESLKGFIGDTQNNGTEILFSKASIEIGGRLKQNHPEPLLSKSFSWNDIAKLCTTSHPMVDGEVHGEIKIASKDVKGNMVFSLDPTIAKEALYNLRSIYIHRKFQVDLGNVMSEEGIIAAMSSRMLLVGLGGSGKTSTLWQLAQQMKLRYPKSWVFHVDANERYKDIITLLNSKISPKSLAKFLLKESNDLDESLLAHSLNDDIVKVNIFLDAVDEIPPSKAVDLIKALTATSATLCVAAREHLEEEMKETLGSCQVAKLEALGREECEAFCGIMWRMTRDSSEDYTAEAVDLVKKMQENLRSIPSNPLEVRLISEFVLPGSTHLPSLYDILGQYFMKKTHTYLAQKMSITDLDDRNWIVIKATDDCVRHALHQRVSFLDHLKISKTSISQLLKFGIVRPGNLAYIHTIFYDYFISLSIISNMLLPKLNVIEVLLKRVLVDEDFGVARGFLEEKAQIFMGKLLRDEDQRSKIWPLESQTFNSYCNSQGSTALHVLLAENHKNLFSFVLHLKPPRSFLFLRNNRNETFLKTAIVFDRKEDIDEIFRKIDESDLRYLLQTVWDAPTGEWWSKLIANDPKKAQLLQNVHLDSRPSEGLVEGLLTKDFEKLDRILQSVDEKIRLFLVNNVLPPFPKKSKSKSEKRSKSKTYATRICPLHFAVLSGHKDLVEYLINNGANINQKTLNTRLSLTPDETPLHLAVKLRNIEIARCLIEREADLTLRNSNGTNLLQQVFISDSKKSDLSTLTDDFVKIFCINEKPPPALCTVDTNGISTLCSAAMCGHKATVEILINCYNEDHDEYESCNPNLRDRQGESILFHAAHRGKWEIVGLLVEKGAEFDNKVFYMAVDAKQNEVADLLLEKYLLGQDDPDSAASALAVRAIDQNKLKSLYYLMENYFQCKLTTDNLAEEGKQAHVFMAQMRQECRNASSKQRLTDNVRGGCLGSLRGSQISISEFKSKFVKNTL